MEKTGLLRMFCTFFIIGTVLSFSSCEKEYENEITEKEVPQAVLKAFTENYPGASVREYSEEFEDGKKHYEISFEFQGQKIDILYNDEGEVVELEETISAEDMPGQIQEAISREIPQYSLILIESVKKEGKFFYEAKVLNLKDRKKYELFFSESGKLLEKEEMGEEEE